MQVEPVNRKRYTLSAVIPKGATNAPEGSPFKVASSAGTFSADDVYKTVLASLEDSKAEDITAFDIQGKSVIADHLVIASGRSHRHVSAVSDRLLRDLKEAGLGTAKVEGLPACDWVLVDVGDVIVHIFRPEVREFYSIEKMWQTSDSDETQN